MTIEFCKFYLAERKFKQLLHKDINVNIFWQIYKQEKIYSNYTLKPN